MSVIGNWNFLSFRQKLGSTQFCGGIRVDYLFIDLCMSCFLGGGLPSFCVLSPMLSVSLDCPLLSVFLFLVFPNVPTNYIL